MERPRIDVLIPVFNGARYLEKSLESICRQSISDICIRVVDDGSTDETSTILSRMASKDKRIKVISRPNGGIVEALNEGLASCTAEFVARHDADDNAYPDRFERQLEYMDANLDCVAISGAARHINELGNPVGTIGSSFSPSRANPDAIPALEPYLIHPFLMVRSAAIRRVGGYRHAYHAEDTDLYWRLREIGALHNMVDILGDYRLHGGSISGQSIRNGRIMSVSSQLTAISAVRRLRNQPDIMFSRDVAEQYKQASGSLQSIYDVAKRQLSEEESRHLQISSSAKLMELAGYRPYELDYDDCSFSKAAALKNISRVGRKERALIVRRHSGTAARIASKGDFRSAMALIWPSIIPMFIYRLLMRVIFPAFFRAYVKSLVIQRIYQFKSKLSMSR